MAADRRIVSYKKKIEESLTHYVTRGVLTLTEANEYLTKLVDTIFGNDKHTGIYEYISANFSELGLEGDALLTKCESLYTLGWRVINKGTKYYLVDDGMKIVADVTGPQTILEPEESEVLNLDQEHAYMFVDSPDASKLVKEGAAHDISPENFKSAAFSYQFVISKLGGADSPLYPFVQSYNDLSQILSRMHYFDVNKSVEYIDIQELYAQGYKINNSVINPTAFKRASLKSPKAEVILTPVRPDTLGKFKIDELALHLISIKAPMYKALGIEVETPIQVGEKGQTFALMFTDKKSYTQVQDLGEVIRILDSMTHSKNINAYPEESYKKITQNVCALYITEVIMLGCDAFTLGDITIDPILPTINLRYTGRVTSKTPNEVLQTLNSVSNDSTQVDLVTALLGDLRLSNPKSKQYLPVILKNLPANYAESLKALDIKSLPKGYEQVREKLLKVIE